MFAWTTKGRKVILLNYPKTSLNPTKQMARKSSVVYGFLAAGLNLDLFILDYELEN